MAEKIPSDVTFKSTSTNKVGDFFDNFYIKNFSLLLVLLFITFIVPTFIGFGKSGFSEHPELLTQFNTYQNFVYVGVIAISLGLFFLFIYGKFKKDDREFRSVGFAGSGEMPSASALLPVTKRITNFQIFLASLILFMTMMLFNYLSPSQIIFTGVGKLGQQFTATDNLIFSGALIPIAENLGMHLVVIMVCIIATVLAARLKLDNTTTAIGVLFIGSLLTMTYGIVNHIMRYGASGYDMLIVGFFWFVMGFITFLTGSFIPAWILHFSNNLFIDLRQYFASSATPVIAGFIIFMLLFLYIRLYIFKGFKPKRKK